VAGEILVGNPAVLKGDLVSQKPTPNFEGIVLFDRVLFWAHLRKNELFLAKPFPRTCPWEWFVSYLSIRKA
jgi:hypothetical protein